jgi:hypothetical protein
MPNPVQFNLLITREDFARAACQMIELLIPYLSPGCARLRLDHTGAVYPPAIADMEAYARPLWAIVPLLAGGHVCAAPLWQAWRHGLIHGVDPRHPEYWGDIGPNDQRMVEMAVMGMALCMIPREFYFDLPEDARNNLFTWLNRINSFGMPANNWRFFRVLVNCGFIKNGLPYNRERMDEDLALIDSHYEGAGSYFDYADQRDYYLPWAFHYYGLVYAHVMNDSDPVRCQAFRERAALAAPRFAAWFAATGDALPYGRSLTYRFAQGAMFSAMALEGMTAPGLGMGELKGLLLGNMRAWFRKPIFSRDGVLTIGYGYPNLNMAEAYNAPGSPYWAMKAFAALALPDTHPFWQCQEKPYSAPELLCDTGARMLLSRSVDGRHVQAYVAGQHCPEHAHGAAKYEKFVYSTAFAFSVPVDNMTLIRGAYDSMLAFSPDGLHWQERYGQESYAVLKDRVTSVWHPYPDVSVHTTIIPMGDWHVRIHDVTTARDVQIAEGGYAICREGAAGPAITAVDTHSAVARAEGGISGIRAIAGYQSAEMVHAAPNTNLLAPRTYIPTLRGTIAGGSSHRLVCAVLGTPEDSNQWDHVPAEAYGYESMG